MRQVLTNPLSGYYMKGDVFGVQGDFITSPEISQMFGEVSELVLVWRWVNVFEKLVSYLIHESFVSCTKSAIRHMVP